MNRLIYTLQRNVFCLLVWSVERYNKRTILLCDCKVDARSTDCIIKSLPRTPILLATSKGIPHTLSKSSSRPPGHSSCTRTLNHVIDANAGYLIMGRKPAQLKPQVLMRVRTCVQLAMKS